MSRARPARCRGPERLLPFACLRRRGVLGASELATTFSARRRPGGEPLRRSARPTSHRLRDARAGDLRRSSSPRSRPVVDAARGRRPRSRSPSPALIALLIFLVVDLPDATSIGHLADPPASAFIDARRPSRSGGLLAGADRLARPHRLRAPPGDLSHDAALAAPGAARVGTRPDRAESRSTARDRGARATHPRPTASPSRAQRAQRSGERGRADAGASGTPKAETRARHGEQRRYAAATSGSGRRPCWPAPCGRCRPSASRRRPAAGWRRGSRWRGGRPSTSRAGRGRTGRASGRRGCGRGGRGPRPGPGRSRRRRGGSGPRATGSAP